MKKEGIKVNDAREPPINVEVYIEKTEWYIGG